MKKLSFIILLILSAQFAQSNPAIIPLPQKFTASADSFKLDNNLQVSFSVADPSVAKAAYFLQKELLERNNVIAFLGNSPQYPTIKLVKQSLQKNSPYGSYALRMNKNLITITAGDDEGLQNGIMSLMQLASSASSGYVKCWDIDDYPLYGWRGVMLDESRHFYGKEKVKMILDWMTFYKLNKFHWHLTDQHGWRIEIKNYPLLTYVGGIGSYTVPYAAPTYYTQEEIKEIVAYAAERNIEVIPEIDMPGHATAANRAYPEFSGGGSKNYPEFTFNPGYEGTYKYLTDILREVNVLFPSEMIHLGGDEVSFGNQMWGENPGIQKLMKDHNLKTLVDVEDYFMQRMADSLFNMNNKLLAWDEMASANFPIDKTIIFWWRHDKKDVLQTALDKNYNVVLCPRIPFYLDFDQDKSHKKGRKWKGEFSSLDLLYNFKSEDVLAPKHQKQVLGVQANIWTEHIGTNQRLDYMLFPRISALAEAAWGENNDYNDYLKRLEPHLKMYEADGIYFFNPLNVNEYSEPKL